MRDPRCRDHDRAEQEIWGRLVLASACALAMSGAEKPKPGPKHDRETDVTMAFRAFLRPLRGREDVDVEAMCRHHTHSARPGRHFDRHRSKESRVRLCHRHWAGRARDRAARRDTKPTPTRERVRAWA